MDKTTVEEEKPFADDNAQTIRPVRSPPSASVPLPLAKAPSPSIVPIAEDFSDFDFADDDAKLEEKVADFRVRSPWNCCEFLINVFYYIS